MSDEARIQKWRLILGKEAASEGYNFNLSKQQNNVDQLLEKLYEPNQRGGLGASNPNVNRWLGDIRKYFPNSMVQVMQKDALERLGLKQMLLEPELLATVEPDIYLVGTILSLSKIMPNETKETAYQVVRKIVSDLEKQLTNPLREAIEGTINKSIRNRRPKHNEINWSKTIYANLKHYQKDYKTIIPQKLLGYGKKGTALKEIILLVDQSGSMADSVVYAGILGSVMASLRTIKTHLIVFDTNVVNLTEYLNDPVELLFSTQLGGGTDINKALHYANQLISKPTETILVLISDLYEGGNEKEMLRKAFHIKERGVQFFTLLALNNSGAPSYDANIVSALKNMNIPCFTCTPDAFPNIMAKAIKQEIGN